LFPCAGRTLQSFTTIGVAGFLWRIRKGQSAAIATALRWGKLSAGFSGGRALGQVLSGRDGTFASVLGSAIGGVAAATSIAEMPSSVITFVGFTLVMERLTAQQLSAGPTPSIDARRDASRTRARGHFERRHRGDPTRLQALSKEDDGHSRNIFGERVEDTVRQGSQLKKLGQQVGSRVHS
jgi:hypothetical protein